MPCEDGLTLLRGAGNQADASAETEFDQIATLAATVCRTAHSAVMLCDEWKRWRRASGAMRLSEHAVDTSLCDRALEHGSLLVLEDLAHDPPRQAGYAPTDPFASRFFAGVPFTSPAGLPAGVLCVMDGAPRVLSTEQERSLELLARQMEAHLELTDSRKLLKQIERERRGSAASLRASEELFRTFMNASPFLGFIKDAAGRLLFYNRAYARRFGISEYAWLGRTDEQLWARNLASSPRTSDLEIMRGGKTVEAEEQLRGTDGAFTHWRTYKFPCYDPSGNLLLAGLALDVTEETQRKQEIERYQEEMQAANEALRRLSVTDELTGLRNRRAFEERLVLEFSMSRRRHRDLAVLLIDVDNFKRTNDRWGHPAGDAVLRRLSSVLRTTVRLPDLVARYGGEEFVVLLPETSTEGGLGFARRLMERMATEVWEHEPVTISVGLASLNDSLLNGFQLVTMADDALYAAKRAGKNRVVVYGSHS